MVTTNDKGIIQFKHKVMEEICRLAWDDNLNEKTMDELAYKLIPGPKPEYRCCIYKEREITRGRIRLAVGENPDPLSTSQNIVQVLKPACDDCPISAYSVTDNCRFCLGKACLNTCKFGAIHPGEYRMHIDAAKCKECGMSVQEGMSGRCHHV